MLNSGQIICNHLVTMKRSNIGDSEADHSANDLESIRKEYKRARKACKHDKSNEELKSAKSKAKKALDEAEASEANLVSSDTNKDQSLKEVSSEKENAEVLEGEGESGGKDDDDDGSNDASSQPFKILEEAYQKALTAFKANKTDKDLRRAKTAARRTLDDAILAASGTDGKQLVCVHCSKKFIFSTEDEQKHKEKGWEELPKKCDVCKEARSERMSDRTKLDSKKKNMCYAFQRGECPHGMNCKFSHNPEHGGKRSGTATGKEENDDDEKMNDNNEYVSEEVKESKDRKELSLRKKGKGWRNK